MSEHRTVCECGHTREEHSDSGVCAGCYHTSCGKNVGCKQFRKAPVQPDLVLDDPRVRALVDAAGKTHEVLIVGFSQSKVERAIVIQRLCDSLRAALQPFLTRE